MKDQVPARRGMVSMKSYPVIDILAITRCWTRGISFLKQGSPVKLTTHQWKSPFCRICVQPNFTRWVKTKQRTQSDKKGVQMLRKVR